MKQRLEREQRDWLRATSPAALESTLVHGAVSCARAAARSMKPILTPRALVPGGGARALAHRPHTQPLLEVIGPLALVGLT